MSTDAARIDAAYKEGVLSQRLAGFDAHFSVINGSIADTANELARLNGLLQDGLANKAERDRVHALQATVAALELRLTAFDATVVRREGPVIDRISENTHRIDVLEASLPATLLKLKEGIVEEVGKLRGEVLSARGEVLSAHSKNTLRKWAAAGSAFAIGIGVVLSVATVIHTATGW